MQDAYSLLPADPVEADPAVVIAPGMQVVTIGPDGSLTGLQYEGDKGLDLKQFGRAEINRASEVIFCTDRQQWHVEFRHAGAYSGKALTNSLLAAARGHAVSPAVGAEDPAYFATYAQGVAGEIDTMNYLRLSGQLD